MSGFKRSCCAPWTCEREPQDSWLGTAKLFVLLPNTAHSTHEDRSGSASEGEHPLPHLGKARFSSVELRCPVDVTHT